MPDRKKLHRAQHNARSMNEISSLMLSALCIVFVATVLSLFYSSQRVATISPPTVMSYQGKLLESNVSVTTTKAMAFMIYDDLTGGSLLYTASGTLPATSTISVTPSQGIFSVDFGGSGTNEINPGLFANTNTLYLEIIVDGITLSPRKQLTAVPFAYNSSYLGGYAPAAASTSAYIPISDTNGNFTLSGDPQSSGVSGGLIYINPSAADADETLFGIAVGGTERFRIDEDGDTHVVGGVFGSSTLGISGTSTFDGFTNIRGRFGSPALLDTLTLSSVPGSTPNRLALQGDTLFYLSDEGLYAIDVTNPADLSEISLATTGLLYGAPKGLQVAGRYAYIASGDVSISSNEDDSIQIVDISNPSQMTLVGSHQFSTSTVSRLGEIRLQGTTLYGIYDTTSNDGLVALDVSDPANPQELGTVVSTSTLGPLAGAFALDVAGPYAYLTSNSRNQMTVVDISDPRNMRQLGSVPSSTAMQQPIDVAVQGARAYVYSSTNQQINIIDISDPYNPSVTTSVSVSQSFAEIAVHGEYLFAGGAGETYLYEINGDSLTQVGTTSIGLADFVVQGGNLYGIDTFYNVNALDVGGANISNADIGTADIGQLHVGARALFDQEVTVRGGLIVGNNGLLVSGDIGITAPTTSLFATNTFNFSHTALFQSSASSSDDAAFLFETRNTLGNTSTLFAVRNGTTEYLTLHGQGFLGIGTTSPNYTLAVSGTTNISGTTTIAETLTIEAGTNAVGINSSSPQYALSVSGTAYVSGTTTFAGGIVDIDGRALAPVVLDSVTSSNYGNPYAVELMGDVAYSSNFSNPTITIFNIADPTNVRVAASTTIPAATGIRMVRTAGNYMYALELNAGVDALTIFDISDPTDPIQVSRTASADLDGAMALEVVGPYAYVALSTAGQVTAVDVSDPQEPQVLSTASSTASTYWDIAVSGQYAYVGGSATGEELVIFDISDPANIQFVSAASSSAIQGAGIKFIEVSGNYAYVSNADDDALAVFDISDPEVPVAVGSITSADINGIRDFQLSGDSIIAITITDQLAVIDISDPTAPSIQHVFTDASNLNVAQAIGLKGRYAFVGTNADGFAAVDIGASTIINTDIGTAKVDNLHVSALAQFDKGVHVRGGLIVGNSGLMVQGDLALTAPTSSLNATNTLRFSHTALFQSSASTTEESLFIFDTFNQYATAASTTYLLSVRNNGTPAFSVASNGDVAASGTIYAESATVGTPGNPGDLAERVDITLDEEVSAGDVMIVDPNNVDTYRKSEQRYEQSVAGVISTNPTIVLGNGKTNHTAVMAMVGRVPINVSTENGSIHAGDLLVTSDIAGHAMKYDPTASTDVAAVSVVGIALESMFDDQATGQILGLVRGGWLQQHNQTISQMQQDIILLADAQALGRAIDPTALSVTQTNNQIQVTHGSGHLNLNNHRILNVAAIVGQNNTWQIDAQGRFVTRVTANGETRSLYAIQSLETEYILSGSAALEDGEARVTFAERDSALIDPNAPIKVSITLTDNAAGVYVDDKDHTGFTVYELNDGSSDATFDWVAIVRRSVTNEHVPTAPQQEDREESPIIEERPSAQQEGEQEETENSQEEEPSSETDIEIEENTETVEETNTSTTPVADSEGEEQPEEVPEETGTQDDPSSAEETSSPAPEEPIEPEPTPPAQEDSAPEPEPVDAEETPPVEESPPQTSPEESLPPASDETESL